MGKSSESVARVKEARASRSIRIEHINSSPVVSPRQFHVSVRYNKARSKIRIQWFHNCPGCEVKNPG